MLKQRMHSNDTAPEKVLRYPSQRTSAPWHHPHSADADLQRAQLLAVASGGRRGSRTVRHAARITTRQDTRRRVAELQT